MGKSVRDPESYKAKTSLENLSDKFSETAGTSNPAETFYAQPKQEGDTFYKADAMSTPSPDYTVPPAINNAKGIADPSLQAKKEEMNNKKQSADRNMDIFNSIDSLLGGFGDVSVNDVYPSANKPLVVGYTQTKSWGSQPLIDYSVLFPITDFKDRAAMFNNQMEMKKAQAIAAAKPKEKVSPIKIDSIEYAPNATGYYEKKKAEQLLAIYKHGAENGMTPDQVEGTPEYAAAFSAIKGEYTSRSQVSKDSYNKAGEIIDKKKNDPNYVIPEKTMFVSNMIRNSSPEEMAKILDENPNFYSDGMKGMQTFNSIENMTKGYLAEFEAHINKIEKLQGKTLEHGSTAYLSEYEKFFSPERVSAFTKSIAKQFQNDIYIPSENENEEQSKERYAKSGKFYHINEIQDYISNVLPHEKKEDMTIVQDRTSRTNVNVVNNNEQDRGKVNSALDIIMNSYDVLAQKGTVKVGKTTYTAGDSYVTVKEENGDTRIVPKSDTHTLLLDFATAENKGGSSRLGNTSVSDIAHIFNENPSVVTSADAKYNWSGKQNSPLTTDPNKPIQSISEIIKKSGEIPVDNQTSIRGITPYKNNSFSLNIVSGENNVSSAVLIPASYVSTLGAGTVLNKTDNLIQSAGGSIVIKSARYEPIKNDNGLIKSYKIMQNDGKGYITIGGAKKALEIPASFITDISNTHRKRISTAVTMEHRTGGTNTVPSTGKSDVAAYSESKELNNVPDIIGSYGTSKSGTKTYTGFNSAEARYNARIVAKFVESAPAGTVITDAGIAKAIQAGREAKKKGIPFMGIMYNNNENLNAAEDNSLKQRLQKININLQQKK